LAAGKVYFKLAGTATDHDSYADAALTTPNTNPVELDGAGEATIFLDPAIAYKVILTDAYDAEVWTVDGVQTPEGGEFTALAVVSDGSIGGNLGVTGTVTANRLIVADSTEVANLNAATLKGKTWAVPDPIGATTPTSGAFTSLSASGDAAITGNEAVGGSQDVAGAVTHHAEVTYQTANAAKWIRACNSEEITLSTGGTTTDSATNLLPSNSIIEAVVARVTATIATATDWKVGDPTQGARFLAATTDLASGTVKVCLLHMDPTVATANLGPVQTTSAKLRVTTTGTPTTGKIRFSVFYRQFVAPTS
jgi:hypothetical protein